MEVRTIVGVFSFSSAVLLGAGAILERFRRHGRDLNGLGKKQQLASEEQDRFERRVIVALMKGAKSEEEKEWLAAHFHE